MHPAKIKLVENKDLLIIWDDETQDILNLKMLREF